MTADTQSRAVCEAERLCSFTFTVNGYYQMFEGMKKITGKKGAIRIPRTLPILLASGKEDPVGDFGKTVEKIYGQYREAGIKDVTLKLYEGDRHEILNEQDRQQVYEDIWKWMEERI